jgi:hypothetical protein
VRASMPDMQESGGNAPSFINLFGLFTLKRAQGFNAMHC